MPLFAVERDLSQVPPEHFRSNLQGLIAACARLQALGKKVRYISSAVFPAEARGLCLFGAEEPQWVREVNEAARIPYARIYAVLDLTPTGVRRDLSRGRWPARLDAAATAPARTPTANDGPPSRVADEITRWSEEARQLMQVLGGWLEDAGRLQAEVEEERELDLDAVLEPVGDHVLRHRRPRGEAAGKVRVASHPADGHLPVHGPDGHARPEARVVGPEDHDDLRGAVPPQGRVRMGRDGPRVHEARVGHDEAPERSGAVLEDGDLPGAEGMRVAGLDLAAQGRGLVLVELSGDRGDPHV